MARIDLSKMFLSIMSPSYWRKSFKITVQSGTYRWTQLPFGWCYSLFVCQRVLKGILEGALYKFDVNGFVYSDDTLIVGRCRLIWPRACSMAACW